MTGKLKKKKILLKHLIYNQKKKKKSSRVSLSIILYFVLKIDLQICF
jgi:hypothetical protein